MTYLYQVGDEVMRMHDEDCPCVVCFFNPADEGFIISAPPLVIDLDNPDSPPRKAI